MSYRKEVLIPFIKATEEYNKKYKEIRNVKENKKVRENNRGAKWYE